MVISGVMELDNMALARKKQPVIAIRITLLPSRYGVEFNQSPGTGEDPQHKAFS